MSKPIKIGFDLDGVLLYNPVRIIRPVISLLKKKKLIHRKELQFFVPKTNFEKLMWRLFHKSSLFVSPAIDQIADLVKSGEIEAYIITGRFEHLSTDTNWWFKKFAKKNIFKDFFMNYQDEQPHLFKARKVKELGLDYFIEDNWDIVNFLSQETKTKIVWITNFLDKKISFERKYFTISNFFKSLNFKKKILFLTDYYLPHWTGLAKSFNLLVKALETKVHATVLTINHTNNLPTEEKIDQHLVNRVKYLFAFSRARFAPQLLPSYFKLVKKTDLVVINSPFTFIFPTVLLAKLFNKKVYIFHQGDLILPNGLINKLIQNIFNFSSFISFSLADSLATYTHDYVTNSRLLKYFTTKTQAFLVPLPMDKKTNQPLNKIKSLRQKHQVIIGLAGRFVEEKGFDLLFEAIPQIKSKSVHFVFAGEKNMGYEDFFGQHQQLYQTVKNRITFLGLLSGNELESFYYSIDALVMPSRSDCFGLVQAEAMKYGKPVIVTNIIGARDVVTKTHFGEICETENPTSLAEKIDTLINHKNSYQKYLLNVKKYFDLQKNSTALKKWLKL